MEITKEYRMALSELNGIISNMNPELQAKIPNTLRKNIEKESDKNYQYRINDSIMPQTKGLLSVMISDYLSNDFEKEKFKSIDKLYIDLTEKQKQRNYSVNDIFKNHLTEEKKDIIEYKVPLYKRIIRKIKSFFGDK